MRLHPGRLLQSLTAQKTLLGILNELRAMMSKLVELQGLRQLPDEGIVNVLRVVCCPPPVVWVDLVAPPSV